MPTEKMIASHLLFQDEHLLVDKRFMFLVEKYRNKTGKEPDSKKLKELTAEARMSVYVERKAKEAKLEARKARKQNPKIKKQESMIESEVTSFSWLASCKPVSRRSPKN